MTKDKIHRGIAYLEESSTYRHNNYHYPLPIYSAQFTFDHLPGGNVVSIWNTNTHYRVIDEAGSTEFPDIQYSNELEDSELTFLSLSLPHPLMTSGGYNFRSGLLSSRRSSTR